MPFGTEMHQYFVETKSSKDNSTIANVYNQPRWWFGGVSSSLVACVAAPFDIIKTHMQTQVKKKSSLMTARKVIRTRGLIGFYDGFSAAILRQMTSTSLRFSVYEFGKDQKLSDNIYKKVLLASIAGVMGAAVGIPLDLVNVRMQNDMKSTPETRRNYKHVFDALMRIPREESFFTLYKGGGAAIMKSAIGTIGQIAMYDHIKELLIYRYKLEEGIHLHFLSSALSSVIACVISQPFDVFKTLLMNAHPGQFNSHLDAMIYMTRFGPTGLFRGLMPTIARKGPCTVLLYLIYEQMRLHFGYVREPISPDDNYEQ